MSGFRRLLLPVVLLSIALSLLTACSPSTPKAARSSEVIPASRPLAYPAEDYHTSGPGRPGGTLRVSVTTDTGNLDVHAISATNAQWLGRLLYDNLVYLDAVGEPTPWLAKSWEISPDGLTYTFHLRDDVTFSDGAKFNAEAVLVNLEHMRDPATKSPLAAAYISPYRDGEVVDEFTFRAHLREPYAPFLNVLAQSWLALLSPKAIRENPKALSEHPVGSGPFVVERYTRQEGLILVKRPDYHWSAPQLRHEGPAYLDRIEIDFISEPLVRYNGLLAGQYDFTIDAPPQNAAALRADPSIVVSSRIRAGNPYRALTFNTEKFPFEDVKVRKALARAVDRVGVERVTGFGEFSLKSDFLAASTRHYDPSFQAELSYDPVAANLLLDEAGWTGRDADGIRTKDGRRLTADFLYVEGFSPPAGPVAIQSDLRKVGFDLHITQIPLTQYADRRNTASYDSVSSGVWHTNTPDGLYILYHSDEIVSSKRIGQNVARLRDAALDDLLARARRTTDQIEQQRLYSAAQKRLVEIVPAIPLFENHSLIAYHTRVKGVVFDTSHNTTVFTTVWLDAEAKR